jgi:RNA polymerase sigma-70 factor (ECF subfamily)
MVERAISMPMTAGIEPSRFEEFFDRERDRLFRAMVLATRNGAEAEELVQDAFLKVWERWAKVASMDEPAAYLHRIAFNGFLSRRRRAATALRRHAVGVTVVRDEIAEVDARHAVIAALQKLTSRQRAAVVLIDVLGYGSDEAGKLLGIRPSTARRLASLGRARLREGMGETDA